MASDYGRNFGFRISSEEYRYSNGRYRTPATGNALALGSAVVVDPATPGYMKAGAANEVLVPGWSGILLQEEIHINTAYQTQVYDSYSLGLAKLGKLSVITNGAGVKVWLANTAAETRVDGRVIPAVTIFNTASVTVGSYLGWNGTQWAQTATAANQWMVVTAVDTTAVGSRLAIVEAVLIK